MKWIKISTLISILAIMLISIISCSSPASNGTTSSTPSISITPTPSPSSTPTPSPSPTPTPTPSLVIPTPTYTIVPSPSPSPTPDPAKDKKFFIDRIISGYNKIPRPDGSFEQTPIYQDVFLDLNILGYYTKKEAIFVPRIPTLTDHDDWFIRVTLPGYLTKPWITNWGYTINKSIPNADKATLSTTIYTKEMFDTNYYRHPDMLTSYDLKGDRGPSGSGIYGKYIATPGSYVILLRTNNADAIADFWVKLGTEGNIQN